MGVVDHEACLETALDIGTAISEEAIWDGDHCNWVGSSPEEGPGGEAVMTHAALGPDLYGGTAGVALFLAQLCATAGDDSVRATALGAIRQALARVDDLPGTTPSLYTGPRGVALAALRVGTLLGEQELWDQGARLAVESSASGEAGHLDLLVGAAGALVGDLVLAKQVDEGLVERAVRWGDLLLARANKTDRWYSWSSPTSSTSENLTGLSHGAAGVALALLELYCVTGQSAYREAAELGFEYERHLFDPHVRNWPDLRRRRSKAEDLAPSFAVFWCHGASGIALSRLRAHELLGDPPYRTEAGAGLDTTSRMVRAAADADIGNYSLCHGLGGNAEVLIEGHRALGDDLTEARELAWAAAAAGVERYGKTRQPWPCGTLGGQSPGLFLGTAGIGLFYLRLVDPAIPSILVVRSEAFTAIEARDK